MHERPRLPSTSGTPLRMLAALSLKEQAIQQTIHPGQGRCRSPAWTGDFSRR